MIRIACSLLLSIHAVSAFVARQSTGWSTTTRILASTGNFAPIPNEWQGEVLRVLKQVIDPDLNADIVSLGFVKNLKLEGRSVSFDVRPRWL